MYQAQVKEVRVRRGVQDRVLQLGAELWIKAAKRRGDTAEPEVQSAHPHNFERT